MVIALVNGSEATVKKFYREAGGWIRLQPANATMQPHALPGARRAHPGRRGRSHPEVLSWPSLRTTRPPRAGPPAAAGPARPRRPPSSALGRARHGFLERPAVPRHIQRGGRIEQHRAAGHAARRRRPATARCARHSPPAPRRPGRPGRRSRARSSPGSMLPLRRPRPSRTSQTACHPQGLTSSMPDVGVEHERVLGAEPRERLGDERRARASRPRRSPGDARRPDSPADRAGS